MTASAQRRVANLAADPALHRAFHWLHLHELQLRRWQLEFLAIPAPPFGEAARAQWFLERFRELGLSDPRMDAEGNTVALFQPAMDRSPAKGALLLSAHLDTVFPSETDCTPSEDGPLIRGPGACDNGAGLTALLAVAAALRQAEVQLPYPVIFAANVGEEGEGDLRGMRALFAAPPYDASIVTAIALEGAGHAMVVNRALGSRRLRATVTGPGGHSWADVGRPNPILALSGALLALGRLSLPTQPRTTLNVGTMHGGTSVNSVPSRASADLDLRSTSELHLDRLELGVLTTLTTEIEAESRGKPETDRLRLHIERTGTRAVGSLGPETALFRSLRAVDRHLGIATEPRIGSTDANLPLSLGVPALAMGAGGSAGGLHTTAEWYAPTGRELALRRIVLLLLDACTDLAGAKHLASNPAPSDTLAS